MTAMRNVGTDPTVKDAGKVLDDDADGLVNFQEDPTDPSSGWTVTLNQLSTVPNVQGTVSSYHVISNSKKKDTDSDGLKRQGRVRLEV